MTTDPENHRYSGDDVIGEKFWFSYFQCACEPLLRDGRNWRHPQYDSSNEKELGADSDLMAALQSIAFSVFALEFRMKRALLVMGAGKQKAPLEDMIDNFWLWVTGLPRRREPGVCAEPAEWAGVKRLLHDARVLRNKIGHADGNALRRLLGTDTLRDAVKHHAAVLDAIRLVNWGTGYTNDKSKSRDYWERLKLWPDGPSS